MGVILVGSREDFVDSLGLWQVASIKSIHGLRAYEHVHFSSKVHCHALTLRPIQQTVYTRTTVSKSVYRVYDYSRKSLMYPNTLGPEGVIT